MNLIRLSGPFQYLFIHIGINGIDRTHTRACPTSIHPLQTFISAKNTNIIMELNGNTITPWPAIDWMRRRIRPFNQ